MKGSWESSVRCTVHVLQTHLSARQIQSFSNSFIALRDRQGPRMGKNKYLAGPFKADMKATSNIDALTVQTGVMSFSIE